MHKILPMDPSRPWLALEQASQAVVNLMPWPGDDYEYQLERFAKQFPQAMTALLGAISDIGGLVHRVDHMFINPHDIDVQYLKFKLDEVARLYHRVFLTITRVKKDKDCWDDVNSWQNQLCDLRYVATRMAWHEAYAFN